MVALTGGAQVVVVGGGIGGLAAAAWLARGGARVVVLERSRELGGRGRTWSRDGIHFNMGGHALYLGGEGRAVLDALGVDPDGRMPPAEGLRVVHQGVVGVLPAGARSMVQASWLGWGQRAALSRLMLGIWRARPEALSGVSLAQWMEGEGLDPTLEALVSALVRLSTYCDDPELSAEVAVGQLQLSPKAGVRYLDGGWQAMVDALAQVAWDAGAELRTGARVESVESDGPSVEAGGQGVEVRLASGEVLRAEAAVLAVAPGAAAKLLAGAAGEAAGRLASAAVPARISCLDVALAGDGDEPQAPFLLSLDEPAFFSDHARAAELAPPGHAVIQAMYYHRPGAEVDAGRALASLEGLLDLGRPGWRGRVVQRRWLPDTVATWWTPRAGGGGLSGRPAPALAEAPGIYLVGDWVGARGHLVDASLASARDAARCILAGVAGRREVA